MSIESATYLHQLVSTNPGGTDQRSTADDHIRLIKATLLATFPNLVGEMSASAGDLNALVDIDTTTSVQGQLDALSARADLISASLSAVAVAAAGLFHNSGGTISGSAYIDIAVFKAAAFRDINDIGSASSSCAVDWAINNKCHVLMDSPTTSFTFSNPLGHTNILMKLVQDGSGSRLAEWPATVKWPYGVQPTLSTTAGATDIINFYFDGSAYYGAITKGF